MTCRSTKWMPNEESHSESCFAIAGFAVPCWKPEKYTWQSLDTEEICGEYTCTVNTALRCVAPFVVTTIWDDGGTTWDDGAVVDSTLWDKMI